MVNENENTQPELNMVSEESTAPVAEPQAEPAVEPATEPVAEPQTETAPSTETNSTTETTAPKAEENVGTYPSSVQPDNDVQQTLQQTQQRLQQVEQQNLQNQMLYETENYKQQLAQQGYSNEQIQYAADTYYQNRILLLQKPRQVRKDYWIFTTQEFAILKPKQQLEGLQASDNLFTLI